MRATGFIVFAVIFLILFFFYEQSRSNQAMAQTQEYTAQLQAIQGISYSNNAMVGSSGISGWINNIGGKLASNPGLGSIIEAI